MILSQHPDGDDFAENRKKIMLKYVFEDGDINEALRLIENRDVRLTLFLIWVYIAT